MILHAKYPIEVVCRYETRNLGESKGNTTIVGILINDI